MHKGASSAAVVIGVLLVAGCSATSTPPSAYGSASESALPTPTVTVTTTVTATVAATYTVTTTHTATATVTQPAEPAPIVGPIDVTAGYTRHAAAAHMEQTQREDIVQVTMYDGVLEVLTTMRYPGGGWGCEWEPTMLAGTSVKFVRILHQDSTVFRICN